MTSGFVNCILIGEYFNPEQFEKKFGVPLSFKKKKGDLGNSGRFKGVEVPYGSAELVALTNSDSNDPTGLDSILNLLTEQYTDLVNSGVSEIYLTLTLKFKDQCNWEFSIDQLSKIAQLKIPFSISCYQDYDD